ncbi:hypothetical protein [Antarcticirhabdus aurantiaca]|uniref:Uncharacterized protein n=1 Tax=Antarcticirhabdus aurantiaca TaxID=2606717 RepID=A0ACD4NNC7_9HYPH|nr:hypothetical protein [Antarcticirhabdus aurantiaca]WAJ28361.1 hypothetical protein OXU80_26725 [Jeongeuplla avenae]
MVLYYMGCLTLGLCAGFLVGVSESPVVQYVLPLLFTLIVSSAGVFALRTPNETRFRIAGLTSISLTLPFLLAVIYGTLIRSGAPANSLLPSLMSQDPSNESLDGLLRQLPPDNALEILLFSKQLRSLGINRNETDRYLTSIINDRASRLATFSADIDAVRKRLLETHEQLETVVETVDKMWAPKIDAQIDTIVSILRSLDNPTASLSEKIWAMNSMKDLVEEFEADYGIIEPNGSELSFAGGRLNAQFEALRELFARTPPNSVLHPDAVKIWLDAEGVKPSVPAAEQAVTLTVKG